MAATSAMSKLSKISTSLLGVGVNVVATGVKFGRASQPIVKECWAKASKDLGPPSPGEWPLVQEGFVRAFNTARTGHFLNYTVKEASKKVLVGVEVACWFFIGEIFGRRSLVGYKLN